MYVLELDGQERMIKNGWRIMVKNSSRESNEDLIKRLNVLGYNKIKLYEETTNVRGYHHVFAMCKRILKEIK